MNNQLSDSSSVGRILIRVHLVLNASNQSGIH